MEMERAVIGAVANIVNLVLLEDEEDAVENVLLHPDVVDLWLANDRGEKPPRIENYYEITVPALSDKTFQSHFRVTREAFQVLRDAIAPLLVAKANSRKPTIAVEKQILMVLWLLATPDSYRSVGDRLDVAKSTLWSCFLRVVNALNHVAPTFIKWPEAPSRRAIAAQFRQFARLPHVIGAIDGTYVPISAPREHPETYINRKCFHGMTLQAIGILSLQFTDCFTGYPSSVSDVRIFRNSDIHRQLMTRADTYVSEEEYIIGDKAYPVYKWCIPRFINRGNLTAAETRFNTAHAKTRQVIERVFALFFGKLRRMRYLDLHHDDLYAPTIIAACVVHNICLLHPDGELDNYINEGRLILQQLAAAGDEVLNVAVEAPLPNLTAEGRHRRRQLAQQLR